MKILSIESSAMTASVAVVTEDKMIGEYTTNNKMTHSQTILPMIDELLKKTGVELPEITHIAVSAGPGSFTGLRIGCATAMGMAMALDIPVVSVPTLEAMAYNFFGNSGIICPMMDARRSRVYTGIYESDNMVMNTLWDQTVEEIESVVDKINGYGKNVVLLGDGVKAYENIIEQNIKVPYMKAPLNLCDQRASSVGLLAINMIQNGNVEPSIMCKPIYLRPSQAEQEKNALEGNII